jgi:hypothetical protein
MSVTLQLGSSSIRLEANKPRTFAGRDPQACALAYMDAALSRRHAEVWLENGQTFIRDLGSSNGTWVNGQLVGAQPVQLQPGQNVFLGTVPLAISWEAAMGGGATQAIQMPDELRRMIEMRKQSTAAGTPMPASVPMAPPMMMQGQPMMALPMQQPGTIEQHLGVGGKAAPVPSDLAYRRQGSNNNGVLLIALPGDTFSNANTINGFIEFTATDNETVASISVELVEFHKKGPGDGHIWDRVLVKQGPWKTRKGDVVPLPFALRVPPGTSISGREVIWEIRGQVDINWAVDIDCVVPITMRNTDIEKLRDALGGLDYRIVDLESQPLGQAFVGEFAPPANLRSQLGINEIGLKVEYLGSNLQVKMHIDKKGVFTRDRDVDQTYDLERLRKAPIGELSQFLRQQIDAVMTR